MRIQIDGRDYSFKFMHNTTGEKRGTLCRVFNEAGEQVTYGIANVHPHDNFCKETGRQLSLARAIKTWDKEYRALVWTNYKTWGKNRW